MTDIEFKKHKQKKAMRRARRSALGIARKILGPYRGAGIFEQRGPLNPCHTPVVRPRYGSWRHRAASVCRATVTSWYLSLTGALADAAEARYAAAAREGGASHAGSICALVWFTRLFEADQKFYAPMDLSAYHTSYVRRCRTASARRLIRLSCELAKLIRGVNRQAPTDGQPALTDCCQLAREDLLR